MSRLECSSGLPLTVVQYCAGVLPESLHGHQLVITCQRSPSGRLTCSPAAKCPHLPPRFNITSQPWRGGWHDNRNPSKEMDMTNAIRSTAPRP